MTRTPPVTAGYVLCALLALADLVGLAAIGSPDAPPAVVVVLGAIFGVATLVALAPAWRGVRSGAIAVVVSRVLSALLAIPAFFVDAPTWARLIAGASIALTVLAVGLLTPALRTRVPTR
ncbi:hypothetical protein ACQEVB_25740 [Pseudonocardia sp. CA-107938]|uniref:hypothetical protein n=1 Tax=Pseudonocardia sp. CA-107938 TaxID=3240021 RepID=UPI003D917219